MSYFSSHRDDLTRKVASYADSDTNEGSVRNQEGLWECQQGAEWAVKSHFTSSSPKTPAVVSMPTGAGKTALMMLLAFELEVDKLLIVTTSQFLRSQTAEKFRSLEGLVAAGVVDEGMETPDVRTLETRVTSQDTWESIESSNDDVVVALPHNISTDHNRADTEDIVGPPDDLFDIVFFDEAHHARASSWETLFDDLRTTRTVLLTATPFRRDRQTLPGELVYHYPISKAVKSGIYEKIQLEEVESDPQESRKEQLINRATDRVESIRDQGWSPRILVRTNTIDDAENLVTVYDGRDIELEPVHSDRDSEENKRSIDRVENGEIGGVAVVGKLGEGLDLPALDTAVFHSPPMSLPFTVQLVGRIARPGQQADINPTIIAAPEHVFEGETEETVRRLYKDDRGWSELIPEVVEEFLTDHGPSGRFTRVMTSVDIDDLRPYKSVRLYWVKPDQIDLETDITFEKISFHRLSGIDRTNFSGFITERRGAPTWASKTSLKRPEYDLHLYYYHNRTELLFEYTTSDQLATDIRTQVATDMERVDGQELASLLEFDGYPNFLVAGLDSAQASSGGVPSYKMYMGNRSEAAVDTTDSQKFAHGHALARTSSGTTIGVSDKQGRVWSMGRADIMEFRGWCRSIGEKLDPSWNQDNINSLGLRVAENVDRFSETPFLVELDPEMQASTIYLGDGDEGHWMPIDEPRFEIGGFQSGARQVLDLEFRLDQAGPTISCSYDISDDTWYGDITGWDFKLEQGSDGDPTKLSADQFLREYPPEFYVSGGQYIRNGRRLQVEIGNDEGPEEILIDDLDWSGCDITAEEEGSETGSGVVSIHEWLQEYLKNVSSSTDIIFKDHIQYEAADFIRFDIDSKTIALYHCKSSPTDPNGEPNVSATLKHIREPLEQILRSRRWVGTYDLIEHIDRRDEDVDGTEFLRGENTFRELMDSIEPETWTYQIVLVQPGLEYDSVQGEQNVSEPLIGCQEWLRRADAQFRVMGDADE